jgi:hypothetical protein
VPPTSSDVDSLNIGRSSIGPMVAAMTIVTPRKRVTARPRHRPLGFDRIVPPALARDDGRDLARIALDVVVRSLDPASIPPRWSTRAFGREVALVRAQLAPILSRKALAESFRREAAVAATATPSSVEPPEPPGPVRGAYAIRWLELVDDRIRPNWEDWAARSWSPSAGAGLGAQIPQRNGEIST